MFFTRIQVEKQEHTSNVLKTQLVELNHTVAEKIENKGRTWITADAQENMQFFCELEEDGLEGGVLKFNTKTSTASLKTSSRIVKIQNYIGELRDFTTIITEGGFYLAVGGIALITMGSEKEEMDQNLSMASMRKLFEFDLKTSGVSVLPVQSKIEKDENESYVLTGSMSSVSYNFPIDELCVLKWGVTYFSSKGRYYLLLSQ